MSCGTCGEETTTEEKPIGTVTHYYNKIGVGIIDLDQPLKVGDKIHIKGRTTDFTQEVSSIQIEHKDVNEAKAKDVVGVKVDQQVREGDQVFKV